MVVENEEVRWSKTWRHENANCHWNSNYAIVSLSTKFIAKDLWLMNEEWNKIISEKKKKCIYTSS